MNLPPLVLTFVALVPVVFTLPLKNASAVRSGKTIKYLRIRIKDIQIIDDLLIFGCYYYCNSSLSLDIPCKGIEVGRVRNNENPRLDELSGLVASRRYNSPSNYLLYSIEDSGNENVVYAINIDGALKGTNREIDVIILCEE